ncbi:MAG TPA: hypothetical protein PLZ86_07230, partial [bacterium]|nr:hypothetical protein [bacterium]
MRPHCAMSMEQRIIGAGVGTGGGTSATSASVDQCVDFLMKFYGIIAQPVSTERGVELRAIDGETVGIIGSDGALTLEPSGEKFDAEDVAYALAPRAQEKSAPRTDSNEQTCSVEEHYSAEEGVCMLPEAPAEKQVCEAPVWPPAAQSYAECDPNTQSCLIHKDDGKETKNSAKRLAGESPMKNSKPAPSKDDAPVKESVKTTEGKKESEIFAEEKEDLFSRTSKSEEPVVSDVEPIESHGEEGAAKQAGEPLASGAAPAEPAAQAMSTEDFALPPPQADLPFDSLAMFVGVADVAEALNDKAREAVSVEHALFSGDATDAVGVLLAALNMKSEERAFAAMLSSIAQSLGPCAASAKADLPAPAESTHSKWAVPSKSFAREGAALKNQDVSSRVMFGSAGASDGGKARAASIGGGAILGALEDPSEIANWTAP